jgi:hypothetical protein
MGPAVPAQGPRPLPVPAEAEGYVQLRGNVDPRLLSARELGPAPAQAPMARMILALKLPPGAEARLERRLADLGDSRSPRYRQWLTPDQFGVEFGPGQATLDRVTDWLRSGGFTVDDVAKGGLTINFSGTVAQVERAFRTSIRTFRVDGEVRQGNLNDPSIPNALADVVQGVVSLHNLPRPAMNLGFTAPGDPLADPASHSLAPGDFATIYNVAPLYQEGIDGSGVTIAIVGRTHIPLGDIATFRRQFALPAMAPEVIINGPDPGDLGAGEDGEADLDVEWAGAVARNATIRLVVSASTATTDGVDLSAQYIVNYNLAPILSSSFGQCEPWMGAAELAFYQNLWAQAAAQGITALVAAGDSGPAGCDSGGASSGSGRAVSGLASTPYDVAVGGSQFNEGSGRYWRSVKDPDGTSALGYIPERAWNESGSMPGGSGLWAGGGGTSSIYPKPEWQWVEGVPGSVPYRCLPDVALTAASHDGYLIQSGGRQQVTAGTSCSTPAFAGLMALVVQKTGERQGNAGPVLYRLGGAQYRGCGPLVFHDVTTGNTGVPGTQGYACTAGYDLATGLGSVDAQALVGAWSAGFAPDVDAVISEPAADRTVASGTCVPFQGAAHGGTGSALACGWDFGDGASAQGPSCHHTFRNPGPAPVVNRVTFTARDGQGDQGSDTRSVTVLPPPLPGERIRNGGFEIGKTGWAAKGGVSIGDHSPMAPAHQGTADAWFPGRRSTEVLQQTVLLPARAASARLSFWLHIDTRELSGLPLGTFTVKARGANGLLAILGTYSNLDAAPGFQLCTFNLNAYLGQTVQLSFVASDNPKGLTTSFVLDDVSLIAQ